MQAISRPADPLPQPVIGRCSLVLQPVRPVIRRWLSSGHVLVGSSSSPAGVSPVRVVAREPGSRLAASGGNVRG
jgi:hypothetical protein